MVDCGRYNKYITIMELVEDDEENEIGEKNEKYVPVAKFFARFESRVGSLLAGRQADTRVEKTTHKVSYPMLNFPLLDKNKHRIEWNEKTYAIDYVLDDDDLDEEMQVYVSCEE